MTSTLKVDTIQGKSTAGTVAMPSGSVVQVVHTRYGTYQMTTSSSYVEITGLATAITPKFQTSKMLLSIGLASGNTDENNNNYFKLLRDTTDLQIFSRLPHMGADGGHIQMYQSVDYYDDHNSSSAITYKIQWKTAGGNLRLNDYDGSAGDAHSSITIMEIMQ